MAATPTAICAAMPAENGVCARKGKEGARFVARGGAYRIELVRAHAHDEHSRWLVGAASSWTFVIE